VERSKYYAVWALTEGASILTGLGFTGYNSSGTPDWNGAANVDVWGFEFAENFKVLLDSWNIKTNVWLRECMYKRVTHKGKKAGFKSGMLTKLTSAVWVRLKNPVLFFFFFAHCPVCSMVSFQGTTSPSQSAASFRPLHA
jgi:lysophospholipid acyltransferase